MNRKKHAYLIMAHGDWELFSKLVKCLDDSRNTLYVHIDKKSAFDPTKVYQPHKAEIHYIRRRKANWGGFSLVEIELDLLKSAVSADAYKYYHLISGQDLPIKSQDAINAFFEKNNGKNYIQVNSGRNQETIVRERLSQYHFFQEVIGRNKGLHVFFFEKVERVLLFVQKRMGIDRLARSKYTFYKGGEWFSITHEMAQYVLSCEKGIRRLFRYSLASDELFLQTISMASKLRDTIVDDDLREIDWIRGTPYVFREDDYQMLLLSPNLFARKFSTDVDKRIIEKIIDNIS